MYLEVREKANLSREEAAHQLHIGNRTLFNYEMGMTEPPADVVLGMAQVYGAKDLPVKHCSKRCLIGQEIAHRCEVEDLAHIVLGLLKELGDVETLKARLIAIAADGKVTPDERAEFEEITQEVVQVEKQIFELRRFAIRSGVKIRMGGKEKAASARRTAVR